MKEDILSHIQNNREVSRIYSELKAGFLAYNRVTLPKIREEDREEIYNDSFIDLIDRKTPTINLQLADLYQYNRLQQIHRPTTQEKLDTVIAGL